MREYFTQMEAAKKGIITPEMKTVAEKEFLEAETIRERVALGQIAIPANVRHTSLCAEGIGKGLRTKINVNLGISGDANNYEVEMDKVRMALRFGAEAIMDLSNYGKTNTFRQQLIELSPAMIGTVPMYQDVIRIFGLHTKKAGALQVMKKFDIMERPVRIITKEHCRVTIGIKTGMKTVS